MLLYKPTNTIYSNRKELKQAVGLSVNGYKHEVDRGNVVFLSDNVLSNCQIYSGDKNNNHIHYDQKQGL